MDAQPLIDAKAVAERFGLSNKAVYALARAGVLPGTVRVGRSVRFRPDAIDQFIASGGAGYAGGWRREDPDGGAQPLDAA